MVKNKNIRELSGNFDKKQEPKTGYRNPPINTRFQPGESGNPDGKPVGTLSLTTLLKNALDKHEPIKVNGKERKLSRADIMILKFFQNMMSENIDSELFLKYFREALDRVDGKPAQELRGNFNNNNYDMTDKLKNLSIEELRKLARI
ncbi:hypothetical protein NO1_1751 [Candidatus Termititenax aidoneus]|uniref:DUF5681 domain-containing protein n=1 Tax=Termititenax aidoneus TaxID=2218524 RepID=A0A388TDN8_TERA1|nr:hypothetical protein NO1_1751 [Candidatus Termititenax aidoneus]